MALKREDCIRKERYKTSGGTFYYKYFYKCSKCDSEISSQHTYLIKHSGLCMSCSHKGRLFGPAYTQLLHNQHKGRVDVELTYEDFYELCQIKECHCCLSIINRTLKRGNKGYRGYFIDRKDNNKAYTKENCVPCCWKCNQTKGNRFTYEQFMKIAEVIRTF